MQLLGAALLVSPFFFWGTSMVAMKVCAGGLWAAGQCGHMYQQVCTQDAVCEGVCMGGEGGREEGTTLLLLQAPMQAVVVQQAGEVKPCLVLH